MHENIHELNVRVYKFSVVPHENILTQFFLARAGVTCAIYCACIADNNDLLVMEK